MTGELTTLFKLRLKNTLNQTSEDKTHRILTLIAPSLLTYITTGLTIGTTMNIERATIETITILLLISITSSSKLMLKNIHNQTSEVKTHRTLTLISLSLPTYTTTGLTIGTTTSTERETIEMTTTLTSTLTTNSDW